MEKLMFLETGQQATPEQIAAWKAEHGEIFKLYDQVAESDLFDLDEDEAPAQTGGVRYLYVRKPTDLILELAAKRVEKEKKGGKRFTELVLKNIWLAGHRDFLSDSGAMMSIGKKIEELLGIVEVELEKL